jgi:glutathione S-transferase
MITLFQFAPAFGLPNASPFCMKVETWLRMAGLPYTTVNDNMRVMKSPKGKMPFVEADGEVIADSSTIIQRLTERHGVTLDEGLTPAERGTALAFQRLFEEHLYWAVLHERWVDDDHWPLIRDAFFGSLSPPLKWVVPALARRGTRASLKGQGMGRFSPAEIHARALADVDAVVGFLADKPFLMGDRPRTVDATAYAFVANLLWGPLDSALTRHVRAQANLQGYAERMRERYFGQGPQSPASAA